MYAKTILKAGHITYVQVCNYTWFETVLEQTKDCKFVFNGAELNKGRDPPQLLQGQTQTRYFSFLGQTLNEAGF